MKRYGLVILIALSLCAVWGNTASAGPMHDSYMDAAQKLRDAADNETDPDQRQRYLDQADEMERNARSLESNAPVFKGDQIQNTLNEQLHALEQQRQQMQQRQSNSPHHCSGGGVCALVAPK